MTEQRRKKLIEPRLQLKFAAIFFVTAGIAVLTQIIVIGFLLHQITRFFSGQIFVEQLRFIVLKHGFPLESDEGLVRELGKILRVKLEEDDTVESYTERVRAKMKLPKSSPRRGSPRRPDF